MTLLELALELEAERPDVPLWICAEPACEFAGSALVRSSSPALCPSCGTELERWGSL